MKVYRAKKSFVLKVEVCRNDPEYGFFWEPYTTYNIVKNDFIGRVPENLPDSNSADERYNPGVNFYPYREDNMYYAKLKIDDEVEILDLEDPILSSFLFEGSFEYDEGVYKK